MKFVLGLILITQVGCSFIVSAAGSFVGNLGAEFIEEELKSKADKEKDG